MNIAFNRDPLLVQLKLQYSKYFFFQSRAIIEELTGLQLKKDALPLYKSMVTYLKDANTKGKFH